MPSCRMTDAKRSQVMSDVPMTPPAAEALQSSDSAHWSMPSRKLAKQGLRLPSFQALGIGSPPNHPTALLTPPEEVTSAADDTPKSDLHRYLGTPSVPFASLPYTPDGSDTTPRPSSLAEANPVHQTITVTTPHGHVSAANSEPTPPVLPLAGGGTPVSTFMDPVHLISKLERMLNSFVQTRLILIATTIQQGPPRTVYNVLCHSQPCPLPSEGMPTTAFSELLSNIHGRISYGAYIEITHAVPVRFSMGQVPHSPILTPQPGNNEPADYFSIQNTFSKAVVATSYQDALESSVPSSPHPVVAPSTVHVSLLERYIPPSSSYEFQDLFSNNAPSALVNRITELSPERGSLLFIYPTKTGAQTFNHNYLGPLLHPLLRRMAGVHSLASDLGAEVAKLGSIDHLLGFEDMVRKLELLLRKLSRVTSSGPSAASRPLPPKYEVVYKHAFKVPLQRKSWEDWFIHQEKARISEIVSRYFRRGYRLPTQPGITAGTICREMLEGLTHQEYAHDCPPREGVELGVFVVQRIE